MMYFSQAYWEPQLPTVRAVPRVIQCTSNKDLSDVLRVHDFCIPTHFCHMDLICAG